MSKLEMYSKKLGRNMVVLEKKKQSGTAIMGWVNSAWSKSGWKKPMM